VGFLHHAALALLFLVIGSSVGSFLNVCAYRIPRGLSILRPRSRCPRCKAAIRAYDNVPVLGWLMLRGRCRGCGGQISPRYPLVELATGVSFAVVYLAWVALAPTDIWEHTGAAGVILRLLLVWSLTGIVEGVALIVFESRGIVNRLPFREVAQSDRALGRPFDVGPEREIDSVSTATAARAPSPTAARYETAARESNRRRAMTAETRLSERAEFGRSSNPEVTLHANAARQDGACSSPN
jgi:Bacterial Peptidase A24 N-terminal domain